LRDRELQRDISAALNVAESWNAGNAVLHYGKGGDIPGNRRDEQELTVLCLRVLQASVSYLNTLLIQDVLADGDLKLAAEDQWAITPLFWSHIASLRFSRQSPGVADLDSTDVLAGAAARLGPKQLEGCCLVCGDSP
jgi:hypothetical protein